MKTQFVISIDGRLYEGWYSCPTDAVQGAMRMDELAGEDHSTDMVVHVERTTNTMHRTTPGLKRIRYRPITTP